MQTLLIRSLITFETKIIKKGSYDTLYLKTACKRIYTDKLNIVKIMIG